MTAQVLFFNDFSEKDPHLNAVVYFYFKKKQCFILMKFIVFTLKLEALSSR